MINDLLKIASIVFLANLLIAIIVMVHDAIRWHEWIGNIFELGVTCFFTGLAICATVMLVICAVAFLVGG